MIFNSVSKFDNTQPKPLILSYMHLSNEQYLKLKEASDGQIERNKKKEEEQRFLKTMEPVDALLDQLKTGAAPQTGKPEEFLANAQPLSSAADWDTNLTPNMEMQPDPNPIPTLPETTPTEPVAPQSQPVPETPVDQTPETSTEQTPETPAEDTADKSSLPL